MLKSALIFARLMRLHKPIGIYLLLFPCIWSWLLASDIIPDATQIKVLLIFITGSVVLRSIGCIINDILDRDIDKSVARTATRPLASGEVTVRQALCLTLLLFIVAFLLFINLNPMTQGLSILALGMVFIYPLAKRAIWWPQLILGIVFNIGALMGWSAVRNSIDAPAFWLYFAGIFWTLAYDTVYACQDIEDDALIGVRSSARRLGKYVKHGVFIFQIIAVMCLLCAGYLSAAGVGFYICCALAGVYAVYKIALWTPQDTNACASTFKASVMFGLLISLGCAIR